MDDKPLLGVWVVARVQPTHHPKEFVSATLFVGEKSVRPSFNSKDFPLIRFFSNKNIRKVIQHARVALGFKLGTMSLSVDPNTRSMEWASYHPLDNVPSAWSPFNFNAKRQAKLRKAGIAQLSEYIVLNFVQKNFLFVEKVWHIDPRPARIVQLGKRDSSLVSESPVFDYSLNDGLCFLREKIARDMWKHVPPKYYVPPHPSGKRAITSRSRWSHKNLVRRRKVG